MNFEFLKKYSNGKPAAMGLRTASKKEILEVKRKLQEYGIPFIHKQKDLPFNGVIYINPSPNS